MKNVLFVCVNNSCRSQMAEAFARRHAPENIQIYSAGTNPTGIHPRVFEVMGEIGAPVEGQYSKSLDEVPLDRIDTCITICGSKDSCPSIPGAAHQNWGLPNPAAAFGTKDEVLTTFRSVRDEINKRVKALFGK
ncbi:MAG: arsenate reductase ArsC [Planctomycetota bacterium]|nr:MAG: arsenate reductase ArsC [Planctomycetota bacterium]